MPLLPRYCEMPSGTAGDANSRWSWKSLKRSLDVRLPAPGVTSM